MANVGGILKVSTILFFVVAGYIADTQYNMNIVNSLFRFNYEDDDEDNKENGKNSAKNNKNKKNDN